MKQLFVIIALALSINSFAQDDKTVALVVSGQGKTQDEAKQNALRSAIEQAFGTFISSKTEILNDNLIKDEIVSVSNGNIQKFEIISESHLPNGVYSTSLKAIVAVSKLSSFIESKGYSVDLKGTLFAFNIEQQKLMEKSELICVENFIETYKSTANAIYDYKIDKNGEFENVEGDNWKIPLLVEVSFNKNVSLITENLFKLLNSISLTKESANDYLKLKKNVFPVCMSISKDKANYFVLRNEQSVLLVNKFLMQLFEISNDKFCVYTNNTNNCIQLKNGLDSEKTTIHRNYFIHDGWKLIRNPYFDDEKLLNKLTAEGSNYVVFSNIANTDQYKIIARTTLSSPKGPGQYSKTIFSIEHLKFIKKMESKILTNNDYPQSGKYYDNLFLGQIFSLQEAVPNSIYYKFYFNDLKSLNDIKKTGQYLVKSN